MTIHLSVPGSETGNMDAKAELLPLIQDFDGISLSGLAQTGARLLSRIESKYLMTLRQCCELIRTLSGSYHVLDIGSTRVGRYITLYYDTPSFQSYLAHHNGKGNRYKLRLRHYDSSGQTYLEVKQKNNRGETKKIRIRTRWPANGFLAEQEEFLESALPSNYREFSPVIKIVYDRITLVSTGWPERITFDSGITFLNGRKVLTIPEFVVGEIKCQKGMKHSPAQESLLSMRIPEQGFSKYCIGVSLIYDGVKHNRFKPKLRLLSQLSPIGGVAC